VGSFISSNNKWWESVVENKKRNDELDDLISDYKTRRRSSPFSGSFLKNVKMLKKYGLDL